MDDTKQFERDKRRWAVEMGKDEALSQHAREVMFEADKYHYSYQWSWLGLPIIQLPEDVLVTQEIVWNTRPTVIVETGIARGGSMILLASLLQLIGEGKVLGVDIDIRPHNRGNIERHPFSHRVQLIEGSSTAPDTVKAVQSQIGAEDRVMVILDSDHTHDHVLAELRSYAPLVTSGQYLIVADTALEDVPVQTHRPRDWRPGNNPKTALQTYMNECDRFEADIYVDSKILVSASPGGYLRCIK